MYEDDVVKKRMYQIWSRMRNRCNNPNDSGYENYGAKGITVSEEWQDFDCFYTDMLIGHGFDLSINRKDNTKGYSKENCHWATIQLQSVNKGLFSNNTSGSRGIYPSFAGNFKARINVCYKNINLGTYTTVEEAEKARKEAEMHYYGFVFDEGVTEDYLEKLQTGWVPLAERVFNKEVPLIGFHSSNSTKTKLQDFGIVDAKEILTERKLKYRKGEVKVSDKVDTSKELKKQILEIEIQILEKKKEILLIGLK